MIFCQSHPYQFICLCQTKPSWSSTKTSKLVEASALNKRCWMSQRTQCLGSVVPLVMFDFQVPKKKSHQLFPPPLLIIFLFFSCFFFSFLFFNFQKVLSSQLNASLLLSSSYFFSFHFSFFNLFFNFQRSLTNSSLLLSSSFLSIFILSSSFLFLITASAKKTLCKTFQQKFMEWNVKKFTEYQIWKALHLRELKKKISNFLLSASKTIAWTLIFWSKNIQVSIVGRLKEAVAEWL